MQLTDLQSSVTDNPTIAPFVSAGAISGAAILGVIAIAALMIIIIVLRIQEKRKAKPVEVSHVSINIISKFFLDLKSFR